jgi:transposase
MITITTKTTLGIDISKQKFDVALLIGNKLKHKTFSNNTKGYQTLLTWLSKHDAQELHACMEATGVYGEALAEYCYDNGINISIVNPARVKGFAQSEQLRTKTDKVDAGLIARFCLALVPSLWQPLPIEIRHCRDLVRRLEALGNMHRQESNRLEGASDLIAEQLHNHLEYLDDEIKKVKKMIKQHIDNHPDMKQRKVLLESIPGIGEATINVILSEFGNITQFKNAKALAAFIGVAPKTRESGTSLRSRARMSKMGRSNLRKAFFMPALVALRYNPLIMELKLRLTKAGKSKMAIVGAAMRKLVHIIYGVLKSGTPFDEKFA